MEAPLCSSEAPLPIEAPFSGFKTPPAHGSGAPIDVPESPLHSAEARTVFSNKVHPISLPRTAYTPLLFAALLFDWLITLTLTLTRPFRDTSP